MKTTSRYDDVLPTVHADGQDRFRNPTRTDVFLQDVAHLTTPSPTCLNINRTAGRIRNHRSPYTSSQSPSSVFVSVSVSLFLHLARYLSLPLCLSLFVFPATADCHASHWRCLFERDLRRAGLISRTRLPARSKTRRNRLICFRLLCHSDNHRDPLVHWGPRLDF